MESVVVDTNVFGAVLRPTDLALVERYQEFIADKAVIISFMTVAELEFGAAKAKWGTRRCTLLEQLLATTQTVWPGPTLLREYVSLRARCVVNGHGLAEASHEADRWIAATASYLAVPLVTRDRIFVGTPGVDVVTFQS